MSKKTKIINFSDAQDKKYKNLPNPASDREIKITVGDFFILIKAYEYGISHIEEKYDVNLDLEENHPFWECKDKLIKLSELKDYIKESVEGTEKDISRIIGTISGANKKYEEKQNFYSKCEIPIRMFDHAVLISALTKLADKYNVNDMFADNKKMSLTLQVALTLKKMLDLCNILTEVDPHIYPHDFHLTTIHLYQFHY